MVDWAAARAFTMRTCADVFDVMPCRMLPRRGGLSVNHVRQDDASRLEFDFLGTIDEQPSGDLMARHRSADPATGKVNPYFDAVLTAYVAGWAWLPRKDDHVLCGGTTWRIAAEATDGGERRAWFINRN